MASLAARAIETPLGPMLAVASERGVCVLEFLNRRTAASAMRMLSARLGTPIVAGPDAHIERLRRELDRYFAGTLRRFRAALDLRGTPFQRAVWRRLSRVPYGATVSYTQLAGTVGRKAAVRAVGHANGRNPVAIVVPCHRVVGTDGSLRGYGGGLWRKGWLIAFERGSPPRDFRRGSPPRSGQLRG